MKPAPFAYAAPVERGQVLSLLGEHAGEARLLAGGQSLLPLMNLRLARPGLVIDLGRVGGLDQIRTDDGWLVLGAMTRQLALERSGLVARGAPLLAAALPLIGHVATRSRGTLGGSIAHADPAAELPAVLLALDGEVVAESVRGERVVPARSLFLSALTTSLAEDELVASIRVPLAPTRASAFVEVSRRHGDFALIGAAVSVQLSDAQLCEDAAIALCGVAEAPVRLEELERVLLGRRLTDDDVLAEASHLATTALDSAGVVDASAQYRRRVAGPIVVRALKQAASQSTSVERAE
ncbi:MAG TPA: FAD binding domain-containing protein [Solirubrobacteraceae bacterium]|nr:FAD binding domain-containing protein [Solirubrobacteraceae bacterium]